MQLQLMPDGKPGDLLGIAHTLKHYLSPRELWEDVADAVPEELRPLAVSRLLASLTPPAWEQYADPSPALLRHWPLLRRVYRDGYSRLVQKLARHLPEPGPEAEGWVRVDSGIYTCHPGDGILLSVWKRGGAWQLRTAYRPQDFKLNCYECPPRDPHNVSLRRKLAEYTARRRLAALAIHRR